MQPFGAKILAWQDVFRNLFSKFVLSLQFLQILTMVEESGNIYQVNKLLELEAADWQRQLERVVGGFNFYYS